MPQNSPIFIPCGIPSFVLSRKNLPNLLGGIPSCRVNNVVYASIKVQYTTLYALM